jgi:hypothetical protein
MSMYQIPFNDKDIEEGIKSRIANAVKKPRPEFKDVLFGPIYETVFSQTGFTIKIRKYSSPEDTKYPWKMFITLSPNHPYFSRISIVLDRIKPHTLLCGYMTTCGTQQFVIALMDEEGNPVSEQLNHIPKHITDYRRYMFELLRCDWPQHDNENY